MSPLLPLSLAASALLSGCFVEFGDGRDVGPLPPDYALPEDPGTQGMPPRSGSQCQLDTDCGVGAVCFNGTCVGDGVLRISLEFSVDSDFDLHVMTPNGSEIFYANRNADGGLLDVDQCIQSCGVGRHVENIFWDRAPPPGTYQIWVVNFDGRGSGPFSIQVTGQQPQIFQGTLGPSRGSRFPPPTQPFTVFYQGTPRF